MRPAWLIEGLVASYHPHPLSPSLLSFHFLCSPLIPIRCIRYIYEWCVFALVWR
jgi:hypothetical protein